MPIKAFLPGFRTHQARAMAIKSPQGFKESPYLKLIKEWIAKSRPSFSQILHISPMLDKITQPFHLFQQKLRRRKLFLLKCQVYYRTSNFSNFWCRIPVFLQHSFRYPLADESLNVMNLKQDLLNIIVLFFLICKIFFWIRSQYILLITKCFYTFQVQNVQVMNMKW